MSDQTVVLTRRTHETCMYNNRGVTGVIKTLLASLGLSGVYIKL